MYTLLVPLGIYARRILPSGITDTDQIVPSLLTNEGIFHPALSALLLVVMVAAAMSSLDSVLLVMASTCQRDVVELLRRAPSEDGAVRAARWYVAVFALVTALLALRPPGGIVTLTAFSGSLYAACFLPAIVFGLYWRRGNGAVVGASFVAGLAVLFVWRRFPVGEVVHEVFPALLLSTAAYVVVARLSAPHGAPEVARLFGEPGPARGRGEVAVALEVE